MTPITYTHINYKLIYVSTIIYFVLSLECKFYTSTGKMYLAIKMCHDQVVINYCIMPCAMI